MMSLEPTTFCTGTRSAMSPWVNGCSQRETLSHIRSPQRASRALRPATRTPRRCSRSRLTAAHAELATLDAELEPAAEQVDRDGYIDVLAHLLELFAHDDLIETCE